MMIEKVGWRQASQPRRRSSGQAFDDGGGSGPTVIGGRYVLCEQIGVGGMARVYLGRLFGSGGFTRVVAVKRMHKELSSEPEFVKMFRDEVRLTSRVVHPNVVQTLDVVDKTGEIFLEPA